MRIIIKIGTNSLLDNKGALDEAALGRYVAQIVTLKKSGHQVALVSSGAVSAGRALWQQSGGKTKFKDPVLGNQILASLGQARLIDSYNHALAPHGMAAAQLLMTRYDFRHRRHCVNIARLMEALLRQGHVLPVINENDSLALEELVFTDNDELAGLIAAHTGADRMIVLTNVDGVYDPACLPDRKVIPEISGTGRDWPAIDQSKSTGGRGGMAAKISAARKLARAGVETIIANAATPDILPKIMANAPIGTKIRAAARPSGLKRWLGAEATAPRGSITVNAGLEDRLITGKTTPSLLPVGISSLSGDFEKGDIVAILSESGKHIGFGQARYDARTLATRCGVQNQPVFIHADALVIAERSNI